VTRERPKRMSERAQREAGGRPARTEAGSVVLESLTVRECSRVKKACWKAMGECVSEVSGRKRSRRARPKGREYMTRSWLSGRVVQDSLGGMLILS
jgi:hypothetical protein